MAGPGPPPLPTLTAEQRAESNLARILAVSSVFNIIALVSVGVRLYTRLVIVKSPASDDAVMVFAGLGALGGLICFILQGYHGLGRHFQVIEQDDFVELLKLNFVQSIVSHIVALGLLKISLAITLLRLSRSRWYTWSLWALIVFVGCYTLMACLTFFFHCNRIEGNWDLMSGAKCYSIDLFVDFALVNTSFNIFTDIVSATLPIPIIWTLKMKRRTRVYLIGILSLGYLAVAAGVVKAVYQIGFAGEMDSQFEQSVQFWGFLQLNLAIIAACAPTFKPLVGHALKLSSTDKYYAGYYGQNSRATASRRTRNTANPENEWELEDNAFTRANNPNNTTHVSRNTPMWDKTSGERSGSEEIILQGGDEHGIRKTTEISVQR